MKFTAAGWLSLLLSVAALANGDLRASQRAQSVPSTARSADAVVKARVQAALASASDVPGREMSVEVSGGVVSLTGKVATPSEQQSTGAIVRAVPGVKDVRFSLRIEPPPSAPPAGRGAAPAGRGRAGGVL